MSDIAIRVQNLSKRYRIGLKEEIHDTLAGALANFLRQPVKNLRSLRRLTTFSDDGRNEEDIIWALKDVSFEVQRGEVVGIIGRNGAGKSTLLKILSRITHPTSGRVTLNGRVSSLLEVGTGFHPELTGRENIYLNGTILGMTKAEIDKKFDEIVDFSGVEKFIDTPVKRYSSGMRVRLAFSVAAHLEPEILLIDEVLAVGDVAFQKKCLGKMRSISRGGRTVLFVSHNLSTVEQLCSRSVVINAGKIIFQGSTTDSIATYLDMAQNWQNSVPLSARMDRIGTGEARFKNIRILDQNLIETDKIPVGGTLVLAAEVVCQKPVRFLKCAFIVYNLRGQRVFRVFTDIAQHGIDKIEREATFHCSIPNLNLLPGMYNLEVYLGVVGSQDSDRIQQAASFQIVPSSEKEGLQANLRRDIIVVNGDWKVIIDQ